MDVKLLIPGILCKEKGVKDRVFRYVKKSALGDYVFNPVSDNAIRQYSERTVLSGLSVEKWFDVVQIERNSFVEEKND